MLNILHLTDFHFRNHRKHQVNQEKIIEQIIADVKPSSVDVIVFSGDLVQSGKDSEDFNKAEKMVLTRLREEFNLDPSKVLICSGNHDMNWDERIDAIFEQLDDKVTTNEELDSYTTTKDYGHSIKPLKNYLDFRDQFYENCSGLIHSEDLYSVFELNVDDKKIGVVSINNSWRAVGLNDTNKLLFPVSKLNESLSYLNKTHETKILIMHHPLSDFKNFNSYDLEEIIYNNFDIMFSGHVHKKETSVNYTTNDGIIKIVTPATLTFDGGHIGYTNVKLDYEENEYQVFNRFFDPKVNTFYGTNTPQLEIPSSELKLEQNRFRKKLKKKFEIELIGANQLLVSRETNENENAFFEFTTKPVLKSQSTSEITNQDVILPDFDWDNFIVEDEDFLILGKGKCGKTILLKKLQLELLRDFTKHNKIPFFIDLKEWEGTIKEFSLLDEFRVYFELNKADAKRILDNEAVVFLIDNYHLKSNILLDLTNYIKENENIKVICSSEETVVSNIEDSKIDGRVLKKLYFHRLRKKHLRELTNNFFKVNSEKKEEIVEKVSTIFTRLSIPFNFWSVSLFLWVFKKDMNNNFQNDVELINLYIEKLLEKEQLAVSQSDFSFEKYKRFLSSLAHEMLTKYHTKSYSMSYPELSSYAENYIKENIRYTISSRDVLEYVENRGILMRRVDDRYTFRLKGIFEYFLANYLTYDSKFLNKLIADEDLYLSFSNEFELYAGFSRDNEEFLDVIYEKTKNIFENITIQYDSPTETVDALLKDKIIELNELKPLIEKISEGLKEGLSIDKQDQVEEEIFQENGVNPDSQSEVTQKQVQKIDESIESLEKSLHILGRVFKNIDEVKSNEKVHEIFDYILDSSCFWGFRIIDEIKLNDIEQLVKTDSEDEAKKLLKVLTNFIPTLVQTRTNDMVGDKNLEKVINIKIDELKKDRETIKNNQYKLFILHFLLLDTNLVKYKSKIDEIIEIIKMPVLRYSILLKLNYYLGFKVNKGDREMVQFMRNKIQKQQLVYNNKTDVGALQQSLEEKKKVNPDK